MSFNFENLDSRTRELMLEELSNDIKNGTLYISPRLNEKGKKIYPELLRKAIISGNELSLAEDLRNNYMNETEQRKKPNGGFTIAKIPYNAHIMLAEGEFNRFYIRAICRRTIEETSASIEVYRAKEVSNPRPESERKIGSIIEPKKLLDDLRTHPGVDTALGLPSGPNSGLSVRLK